MKQIKLLLLLMLVTLQAYSNEQIQTSKEKKAIQNNILILLQRLPNKSMKHILHKKVLCYHVIKNKGYSK